MAGDGQEEMAIILFGLLFTENLSKNLPEKIWMKPWRLLSACFLIWYCFVARVCPRGSPHTTGFVIVN